MQLRNDAMTWRVVDGEVVVLDLKGNTYFKVNGSGALLWQLLTEPRSAEQLADALVDSYAIDRSQATQDVSAFTDDLRARQLLSE